MAKITAKIAKYKLNSRSGNMLISLLAFIATYAVAVRAIDTGSLQQYGLTFLFFVFSINRLIVAARGK